MRPIKTVEIPESLVGEEWAGRYVVNELNAVEYLQTIDYASRFCRDNIKDWDGKIPPQILQIAVVALSVKKEEPKDDLTDLYLPIDMPSKLYEIFSAISLPVNTLSTEEYRSLFLESKTEKKTKQG
ncbi:MAG: hypothetical protein NWE98_02095 [Candidatus Bathyarchaeota archaeon]|nr:hypothetical protein [Candidatus Bathyarchaeota archaeon]